MSTRNLDDLVDRDQLAADVAAGQADARARDAQLFERVSHPAIKAPEYKCYRVIRRFKVNGVVEFEDIGAFKTMEPALAMIRREQGWASVSDLNGKRIAYNWRPMETR
jgi:hypothetical protein